METINTDIASLSNFIGQRVSFYAVANQLRRSVKLASIEAKDGEDCVRCWSKKDGLSAFILAFFRCLSKGDIIIVTGEVRSLDEPDELANDYEVYVENMSVVFNIGELNKEFDERN